MGIENTGDTADNQGVRDEGPNEQAISIVRGDRLAGVPDQGRDGEQVDDRNYETDENAEDADGIFPQGIDDNGHTDVSVEAVAALRKSSGLIIADLEGPNAEPTQPVNEHESTEAGGTKGPVDRNGSGTAYFPEQHERKKNKVDQSI